MLILKACSSDLKVSICHAKSLRLMMIDESLFLLSRKSFVADLKVPTCWEESIVFQCLHCNENPIYVFLFGGIARFQSHFPHSCVCERFIYSRYRSTYFLQQNRQTDGGNMYIQYLTHRQINVDIGTVAAQYLFRIFGIGSLQCRESCSKLKYII